MDRESAISLISPSDFKTDVGYRMARFHLDRFDPGHATWGEYLEHATDGGPDSLCTIMLWLDGNPENRESDYLSDSEKIWSLLD